MYELCYSKINNAEETREIIQDIFKSLWERKDDLTIDGCIGNYLMRSVKFKVIDYYRAKNCHQKHHNTITASYSDLDTTTEDNLSYNELQDQIGVLVEKLPKQCKNVYRLSREKGLTNKEIASFLLISERAVAYHIAKATTYLKQRLLDYV